MDLSGKVAVVTGAAAGMGRGIATVVQSVCGGPSSRRPAAELHRLGGHVIAFRYLQNAHKSLRRFGSSPHSEHTIDRGWPPLTTYPHFWHFQRGVRFRIARAAANTIRAVDPIPNSAEKVIATGRKLFVPVVCSGSSEAIPACS